MKGFFRISDSFQITLRFLFGDRNHRYDSDYATLRDWKSKIMKILKSIETSIEQTIDTVDNQHKRHLLTICNDTKTQVKESKSFDEINEKSINGLVNIVFNLIGERPDNWEMSRVNNKKHWRLNSQRQILYIQNPEQKVDIIIKNAFRMHELNETEEYNHQLLINKLKKDFNNNEIKFLEWYKKHHNEKYIELF
jgi:hypothetical protein